VWHRWVQHCRFVVHCTIAGYFFGNWRSGLLDLHGDDQAVAEAIDVPHDAVEQRLAGVIADQLADLDRNPSVGLVTIADRRDRWIDGRPLPASDMQPALAIPSTELRAVAVNSDSELS